MGRSYPRSQSGETGHGRGPVLRRKVKEKTSSNSEIKDVFIDKEENLKRRIQ